ncbi:NAD(P)-binding domain-containing protein [Actinoplanes couchii]
MAGSVLARALVGAGYDVVLANSRGPSTLADLVEDLGPRARAGGITEAAAAADFAFLGFPYHPSHRLPVAELRGKIVIDNNNYMLWRDGHYAEIDAGARTEHELRQEQLPGAQLIKAFTHIQFHRRHEIRVPSDELPALVRLARPAGAPDRVALAVSSDFPAAVALVTRVQDEIGFDTVDHSPLSESWRSGPGTPTWAHSIDGQSRAALTRNLANARR